MSLYGRLYRTVLFPLYEQVLRGRNTLRYLRVLEEQQWLSPGELAELQWRKLVRLLRHAEEHVPFYRERMRKAGLTARAIESPADFRRLPPLAKDDIRRNSAALVADNVDRRALHLKATGGSTGEPLRFMHDHDSYEWHIAGAARADRWAGWDWGERQFYVWGTDLLPQSCLVRAKKRLHNRLLNMRFVNSFDLTESMTARYARQLNAFRPVVVVGYTNALYQFARFCRDQSIALWTPHAVIASAERLFDYQRAAIEQAFNAPVLDRYGGRELMNIAAECDRQEGLHINADNIYLELQEQGMPASAGQLGEVLATDLNNYAMPFIRYRNDDMAVRKEGVCSCGRGLPLLDRVEGRILDLIVTREGRYVPGELFPHMFKDYPGIKEFQVHQDGTYAVTVRIVGTADLGSETLPEIRQRIASRLGPGAPVSVERVSSIPRTRGGKLRVTISEVGPRPPGEPGE